MGGTQNRPKRNQTTTRKTGSNHKNKHTKKRKKILGEIQYLSEYIENLSAQTNILWKLLKYKTSGYGQTNIRIYEAFNELKNRITQLPCLAQYNSKYDKIQTTDASTKGLGATLWQKQKDGNLKAIGFASRFLSDTKKKYAINKLEQCGDWNTFGYTFMVN